MNQFKDWGFSSNSWRGEKGEYWVLGQAVLSLGFILLPAYTPAGFNLLTNQDQWIAWATTLAFGAIAAILLIGGGLHLGGKSNALTPSQTGRAIGYHRHLWHCSSSPLR